MLIDLAFELHSTSPIDDIEFIICYNDDSNLKHIVCIKNNEKKLDEPFCWIGSKNTFDAMQRERTNKNMSINELFINAVESGADDAVGGFIISVNYYKRFKYVYSLYSVMSKSHNYQTGEQIKMIDTKENGGYSVIVSEVNNEIHLEILQINKHIVYSKKRKVENSLNKTIEKYKYFLIPYEY